MDGQENPCKTGKIDVSTVNDQLLKKVSSVIVVSLIAAQQTSIHVTHASMQVDAMQCCLFFTRKI